MADVAIVGGGFTGLWTALCLKERRPNLSIVLIEAAVCGSGASGKNGGKVHGYWASLAGAARTLGDSGALEIARAGARAQNAIRDFARNCGADVWWRDGASIRVSASPTQDAKLVTYVSEARRLGVPEMAVSLSPAEVQALCASPTFRGGVLFPEGATVHPARLARAMRRAALARGVAIHERTPMVGLDAARPNRVRTSGGEVIAREVVLATNTALGALPVVQPHLSIFSSYAVMTAAAPQQLEALGWHGDEGFSDARMFVHYFRRTLDGRVLMGSGSGPIAYGGSDGGAAMREDLATARRAEAGLRRLLPGLGGVAVERSWGGPIDVSADRLPFFRTLPGQRVHYACGFSGHGVNATYIAGECLASLVLEQRDWWAELPFCTRAVPALPREPLRFIGARAVRAGILACEVAEDQGRRGPLVARAAARLPDILRMRIGVR